MNIEFTDSSSILKPLPISEQQKCIVKGIENHNIMVDTIAVCGNTTTNLHIAMYFNDKKILLLIYTMKIHF